MSADRTVTVALERAAITDPRQRERLQRVADWAAQRTPTEVREIEDQVGEALRERGRSRVH